MARRIAHGGGLIAARRRYPDAPEPWIDLSTGINPVAYPMPALPPEAFTRLPEPEAVAGLEAIAAAAYGARDAAMVVAAPGTQSLIHLLPRLIPAHHVAVIGPTYAEHAAAWALVGAKVSTIPTLDEAVDADVVVVCNPNNPDGRLHDQATLAAVRGVLVVDEAFADLESAATSGRGGARLKPAHDGARGDSDLGNATIVLRSFGKTYVVAPSPSRRSQAANHVSSLHSQLCQQPLQSIGWLRDQKQ